MGEASSLCIIRSRDSTSIDRPVPVRQKFDLRCIQRRNSVSVERILGPKELITGSRSEFKIAILDAESSKKRNEIKSNDFSLKILLIIMIVSGPKTEIL